ncbi:hypothetical protein OSCI_620012 [Kamptonema sp. PCC 6506]|nr:hypothetical protein OSCI_620012 [Kamptonema sp. PCC 6506]
MVFLSNPLAIATIYSHTFFDKSKNTAFVELPDLKILETSCGNCFKSLAIGAFSHVNAFTLVSATIP